MQAASDAICDGDAARAAVPPLLLAAPVHGITSLCDDGVCLLAS